MQLRPSPHDILLDCRSYLLKGLANSASLHAPILDIESTCSRVPKKGRAFERCGKMLFHTLHQCLKQPCDGLLIAQLGSGVRLWISMIVLELDCNSADREKHPNSGLQR